MDDPAKGTDVPQLTVLPSQCTAVRRNGTFCDRESLPDAPFPICVKHAAEVLRFLNSVMPDDSAAFVAASEVEAKTPLPAVPVDADMPGQGVSLVYYVRVGEHIKIGYSSNLRQRVRFYPPDAELLVYEFGDKALEKKRLRQFRKDLRGRLEWFSPSPELVAHIEQLQADARAQAAVWQDHGPLLGRLPVSA